MLRTEKILTVIRLLHEDEEFLRKYIAKELQISYLDGKLDAINERQIRNLS